MNAALNAKLVLQHLANERTFLAWVRSTIAMLGVGIAFVHFELVVPRGTFAKIFIVLSGLAVLIIACVCLICSTANYLRKKEGIEGHLGYAERWSESRMLPIELLVIILLLIIVGYLLFFRVGSVTNI